MNPILRIFWEFAGWQYARYTLLILWTAILYQIWAPSSFFNSRYDAEVNSIIAAQQLILNESRKNLASETARIFLEHNFTYYMNLSDEDISSHLAVDSNSRQTSFFSFGLLYQGQKSAIHISSGNPEFDRRAQKALQKHIENSSPAMKRQWHSIGFNQIIFKFSQRDIQASLDLLHPSRKRQLAEYPEEQRYKTTVDL